MKELIAIRSDEIFRLYAELFNGTHLPNVWRKTRPIILAKKNTLSPNLEDIRTIGISTAWGKVLEKICKNRLVFWSTKLKAISKFQCGCMKGRSLLDAAEDFFVALREEDSSGACSSKLSTKVDIKGAFDNCERMNDCYCSARA